MGVGLAVAGPHQGIGGVIFSFSLEWEEHHVGVMKGHEAEGMACSALPAGGRTLHHASSCHLVHAHPRTRS